MTLAVQIINYNMPESVDKIVETLQGSITIPHFFTIVDNGSEDKFVSKYTTHRLEKNVNKLGGVLEAFEISKKRNPKYIWTISTSMQIVPAKMDMARELITCLKHHEDAVGISPAFIGDITDPPHKLMQGIPGLRFHTTKGSLGMYSLYKSDWILGDGYPDPRLTSTWGTDYEMRYKANLHGKYLLICDTVYVSITKAPAFRLGRTVDTLKQYEDKCRAEMETVLSEKYGKDWKKVLGVDHYA